MDTQQQPLGGARVRIVGTSITETVKADGSFVLKDAPTGTRAIEVDPTTLPLSPALPKYQTLLGVVANRDNHLGEIKLQPASNNGFSTQTTGSAAEAEGAEAASTLLAPTGEVSAGGVTFSLPNNAVATFPAGATGNIVYLTLLANSRTPARLPSGIFSTAIAQLTPFGAQFNPGGKFTFPNTDGLPANAQARLYKLDQTPNSATLGRFIEVGTATVSTDGQRIETAANAITETSIYFAALSQPLTTVTGRVVDSDGVTPVRRALVSVRGQQTFTDGNGGFTLRNVPVPANNQLSIEASFVRPTGRTDRVQRNNIAAVVNGLTRVTPDLVLPSPLTQPNRPPTLIAPPALVLTEGQTRNSPLVVGDPDPNQTVQVTVNGAVFASIVQVAGVNTLRMAPGAGTAGNYTLTLRATDNQGASTTQTVAVTVNGNRPPVLTVPGAQTVAVGQQLTFNVVAIDPDVEQTLTLTATALPSGATFNQIGAITGRFTWTPSANQTGTVTVNLGVSDGSLSDSKQVAITVTGGGGGGGGGNWIITADFQGGEIGPIVSVGNDLYLSRYNYGVFRSPDNGPGWVPFNQGFDFEGYYVYALTTRNGYLIAADYRGAGKIYRTLAGNNNWTPTLTNVYYVSNFVQTGGNIYAATDSSGFFTSSNDGASWNNVSNFNLAFAVIGSSGFYGINGDVYRSINSGGFWSKIGIAALDAAGGNATAIATRGTEVFVGTNFSGIYYTNNNGLSWEQISTGIPATSAGSTSKVRVTQFLVHNNIVYACLNGGAAAEGGGIIRFNDATRAWEPFNNGLTELRITMLAANNSFFYAGTVNGKFFRRPLQ